MVEKIYIFSRRMRIEIASCAKRALTSAQPFSNIQMFSFSLLHTAFAHTHTTNRVVRAMEATNRENACAHCSNNNYHYQFLYSVVFFSCFVLRFVCGIVVDHWHFIDWNMSKMRDSHFIQFKSTVKPDFSLNEMTD